MPEERLKKFIGDAKSRLHGRRAVITGESPEVRISATKDILSFVEQEAQRLEVPLPADHHNLRTVLTDPEKARAIIETGGKKTGA